MNSIASESARREAQWFYVWMAGTCVLIAFGGFTPTYWAKMAAGSFHAAPVMHIHGALFFAWTLFFLTQTLFVATGRTLRHRDWGLFGIALASVMMCTALLATLNSIKVGNAIGMGDAARRFSVVPISALLLFAGFMWAAIANVRNADLHKRFMLLANIPLMHAAMGRVFMTLFAPPDAKGPPPVAVTVPASFAVDLIIVAAMIYDWRTRGRPHKAYLIGLPILLVVQLLMVPISTSAGWMAIAKWVESLAG